MNCIKFIHTLASCMLLSVSLNAQVYDPYEPYTYTKSDSTQPLTLTCFSLDQERTKWIKFTMRDEIVYHLKAEFGDKDEFCTLGWRGNYVFSYAEIECMKGSIESDVKIIDYQDAAVKQYDVRDFFSDDAHIIWNDYTKEYGYVTVTLFSWVPGGKVPDEKGITYDENNSYRLYKACKERDFETGSFLLTTSSNRNNSGSVIFKFTTKEQAETLIERIKKYGKTTDPYAGDPNPYTYTLDHKTNSKITLSKEDLGCSHEHMTCYNIVKDGMIWSAITDSTSDMERNRRFAKTSLSSIPIKSITSCEYRSVLQGWCATFTAAKDGVVNTYDFAQGRRGICSVSLGKDAVAGGYTGSNVLITYFDSKEEALAFYQKTGLTVTFEEKEPERYNYTSSYSYSQTSSSSEEEAEAPATNTVSTEKEIQSVVITIKNTGADVLELYYQKKAGSRDNYSFRVQKGQSSKLTIPVGCSVFYNQNGGRGSLIFTASEDMNGTTKTL